MTYDFTGYVTKNDIRCSDGVTIRHGAFAENDGQVVPLVWNHDKHSAESIIGNVLLEHRDDGVYGYAKFNDTPKAKTVKELVHHGDVNSMSISANHIKRLGNNDVVHGNIYEVSLVLLPANPGAKIVEVLSHSDSEGEHIIMYTDNKIQHGQETAEESLSFIEELEHAKSEEEALDILERTLDTLTPEQEDAVKILFEMSMQNAQDDGLYNEDDVEQEYNDEEEGDVMHSNVFEQNAELQHAETIQNELTEAINMASQQGRKVSEVLHSGVFQNQAELQHSLSNPELLFPDHKNYQGLQVVFSPNTATEHILSNVTKVPTAFVKSLLSDLSDLSNEDLRARGYIKANEKKEQIVGFLSRKTYPKTIYKKQSIDRDDAIDMGDVVNIAQFFQKELRVKLNDEIARAILVGDGRQDGSPDKIDADKIRPIKSDDDFYTIKHEYDQTNLLDLFETVASKRTEMLGSGTPSLYVNSKFITKMRFLRNKNDQWVFGGQQPATREYLASLFGVKEIVECDFLKDGEMIMVNLNDYQMGTNNGGQVTTFDQFDIDYNKQKYLIEARLSGALVRPKAAVYFSAKA